MQYLKGFFVLVLLFDFLMASEVERLPLIEMQMTSLFSADMHGGQIITQQDIRWFNEIASAGGLKNFLDRIIPKADLNSKHRRDLYNTWIANPLGLSDAIFANTVQVGVDIADDISNRFLNVSCDSLETRDLYIEWLNIVLLPTIEILFAERTARIIAAITTEKNFEWSLLELELDSRNTEEFFIDREIDDAWFKQKLSLMLVPVFGYYPSSFYESRALRWVSYTACAGLTVTLLYRYFAIIQDAQKKLLKIKSEKRGLEQNIAKLTDRLLPVDVLNRETKDLIEILRLRVVDFAQRTAEQVRREVKEESSTVALPAGPPVDRRTLRVVSTALSLVNGLTSVLSYVKKQ